MHEYEKQHDNIDLGETFSIIFSHKLLILFCVSLAFFLGLFYSSSTPKKFTSTAVFKLSPKNNGPKLSLSRDVSALAAISGFNPASLSAQELILERLKGSAFIVQIEKELNLSEDNFFNTYNPNQKEVFWIAKLRELTGATQTEIDHDTMTQKVIVGNYKEYVDVRMSLGGALELSVTHKDPKKSSQYANKIMDFTNALFRQESEEEIEKRLQYLSSTLAGALQDLENSQNDLKNFALKNSTLARENFLQGSLKLDQSRIDLKKSLEILTLLNLLQETVQTGDLDDNRYQEIREQYPLIDDVGFRRILGMGESISAWSWPNINVLKAITNTISDRIERLNIKIAGIEDQAELYASSAEDLARLTREAKIAEATYTVLIEQVKSQALTAGYSADSFTIIEYATPPRKPSSPKTLLLLALSTTLGLFVGFILAFINGFRRDVFYSHRSLINKIGFKPTFNSKRLSRLSKKPYLQIGQNILKGDTALLDEILLNMGDENIICVMKLKGKLNAAKLARTLAAYCALSGRKTLICDTDLLTKENYSKNNSVNIKDNSIKKLSTNLDLLELNEKYDGIKSFNCPKFNTKINELSKNYDKTFTIQWIYF